MDQDEAGVRAQLATGACQLAEEIAEEALAGRLERVLVVMMDREGMPSLRVLGCRPSDALGMLSLVQGVLLRKLMS